MTNFFEKVLREKGSSPLRAAWVIEGPGAGAKALFGREGIRFREESFPLEWAESIRRQEQWKDGLLEIGGARVFLEGVGCGRKLVLCGAGHVSLAVIRVAVLLGYRVTVVEDREEFAARAEAAGAGQVICRPFVEALDTIPGDTETAFVIMTREHAHDVECLRRILRKPCAYVGMMGSRTRCAAVRRQLTEEGVDAQRLAEVRMPIGLPIGSRTPAEIAVSVMAEVIQVMNAAHPGEEIPEGMMEELAAAGKGSGVLALIVEKNGEAPRRPGTKMWVRKEGTFLGTVGGGEAEAVILSAARQMILEGTELTRLVRISLKKGDMHCGGQMTVWLLPI